MGDELPTIARLRLRQTKVGRRRRHSRLMRELAAEVGLKTLDIGQRATLSRAAHLALMLEDAERATVDGQVLSVGDIVKANSELRRLWQELRTNAPEPHVETLQEYVARKYGGGDIKD
jgi:hypothetical protein